MEKYIFISTSGIECPSLVEKVVESFKNNTTESNVVISHFSLSSTETNNPFMNHCHRLCYLYSLTRYSLKYSIADLAIALVNKKESDININELLESSSQDDIRIVFELMSWHKKFPNDKNTIFAIEKIKSSKLHVLSENPSWQEILDFFSHQGINVCTSFHKSRQEIQKALEQGARLVPFPGNYGDILNFDSYGYDIYLGDKKLSKSIRVNRENSSKVEVIEQCN
ncbi:hypothetical protein VIBNISFn27_p10049 [Vibrio nigripulchritudo SFn27]|uniref:Uncharacterized protein n=1 Tax=Vibrio nigripulchritudo TaxID=28173 RepID=A0A9P1NJF6_9VIBR|nr:hypothetical protein [Vibrio nigripulchritudo]CBJ93092.1 protein of unknown function [Vibrio nigripulchritudo]CCN38639.1 hypothetical protein VIBNIAM115_p0041 [Vibrio nigripulchritudo AM115]CCN44948.1 hypothetical protein VIBNIFTn2_p0041 [Vibrio nigripulchritudo FTn2]CCN79703.1 hypothetical protein VIBNISO65_p0041 [Vibrio nigripulchritudo SO65]CCN85908.1 hypothetical protein VIBNIBLFn1_p0045 [Vibrio nigripulchritudo BLFn1]